MARFHVTLVEFVIPSSTLSSSELNPNHQWGSNQTERGDHFVQFYNDDATLVESVAGFIGGGLGSGENGLLIVTPDHRMAIAESLRKNGLALDRFEARGQLTWFDAAATLNQFMVDGVPDRGRFN